MIGKNKCLLIVDDDLRMRIAIKDFLVANGYTVIEAIDGENALEIFCEKSSCIDLILLDVMMPKLNGFQVLKDIRLTSLIPVIMLTAKEDEFDQLEGFKNGADDYITKPFSSTLLIARIEAVLRRIDRNQMDTLSVGDLTIDQMNRTLLVKDEAVNLTQREFDLLLHLMFNESKTQTRNQLLNAVWDYSYNGDGRTVDTHIKQLRAKLEKSDTVIETVFGIGYKFKVKK